MFSLLLNLLVWFSTAGTDPYAVITCQNQEKKSKVASGAFFILNCSVFLRCLILISMNKHNPTPIYQPKHPLVLIVFPYSNAVDDVLMLFQKLLIVLWI